MDEETWIKYKDKTKTWAIRINFELLHSEAYASLNYAPAVKVLNWFYEKVKVKVNKKKRRQGRYQVLNETISFPYAEAEHRGLNHRQFSKALKTLYRVGFIDIKKAGSRLKGDWTEYLISDRWKAFGTPKFKDKPWETSSKWRNFGFGSKEKPVKRKRGKRHLLSGDSATILSGDSATIQGFV